MQYDNTHSILEKSELRSSKQNLENLYVSFVVVARNDDHGGNFLKRMQIFTTALCEQSIKHNLRCELIIVDWNPPDDRPKLAEVVDSWFSKEFLQKTLCQIRVIEVPPMIHKQFDYSDKMMLFQMIGKNVGIRRAKGDYIVATNVDLLFSDELFDYLKSKSLKPEFFYRIDRHDVEGFPKGNSVLQQLDYCKNNVIRINRKDGTFPFTNEMNIFLMKYTTPIKNKTTSFKNSIRFLLENYKFVINSNSIFLSDKKRNRLIPPRELIKVIIRVSRDHIVTFFTINLPIHFESITEFFNPSYPKLHTNACGDFTLLKKDKWIELRGYPEYEMFSFNLDSIILQMAYELGLKEIILEDPKRMYHIEHHAGWTPESGEKLLKRIEKLGVPVFDYTEFKQLSKKMHKQKNPLITNKEGWGLGSEILPEVILN